MQPGSSLGPYRILELLGAGGMGEVYLAEDTRLQRRVAVKLLGPELLAAGDDGEALLHEARTAASLNHPSICTVHEVGEAEGRAFIVMEYVEGRTLAQAIPDDGMSAAEVIGYGLQIADALAHAHQRGVVHRDLKPGNVSVGSDGRVKVLDFGLALRVPGEELGRGAESRLTAHGIGSTVGTFQYMAPEVFRGGTADHHSDIWSLGVVLYEMATGHLPFHGDTAFELSSTILRDPPAPLPEKVPPGLRIIMSRCLAKEPSRRYARASEVRAALEMLEAMLAAPAAPAAAAAGAAASRAERASGAPSTGSAEAPSGPAPAIRSLAVLPLANLSGDPAHAYFADGMTEALIIDLAKLGGIKVISRTSVMRYRDTDAPLPEIADELGVDVIVEGSVLRAGDRVRISAQLIHAATDSHLWADSYERDVSDVLALQRDVTQAITREVHGSLRPTAASSSGGELIADRATAVTNRVEGPATPYQSVDPTAYEAVLQARSYIQLQTADGVKSAAMWLERARERAPDLALGYSTLATLRITEALYGEERPPHEVMPGAADAARRALELDPRSAEAHAALGMLRSFYYYEWEAGEAAIVRALELNPNLADIHSFYGFFLGAASRHEEAVAAGERATELDPLSPLAHADRAMFLLWAGRLGDALKSARRAVEVDPGRWRAHWAMGMVLGAQGALDDAIDAFREGVRVSRGGSLVQTSLTQALLARGDREEAMALKEDLEARREAGYISAYLLAAIEASLGDQEGALTLLEQGLEERTFYMVFLRIIAPLRFATIQHDPRFRRMIEKVGIPEPTG